MTNLTNEARIKKEYTKLSKVFAEISENKRKTVDKLIENAAFTSVLLEDLKQAISEKGYISEYQNGANQWGTKKAPEVEIYISTLSNYTKIIKQLTDLLPNEVPLEDDFDKFIAERSDY